MDRLGGAFGAHEPEDHLDDYVEEADADLDPPPSPVGQDERRMQVRAYNHWASLLGDSTFPYIEDLEPELLDDFGPYSVLLDFSTGIENPAVRFIGSELRQECDAEGRIERLSDVPPRSLLSRITDHYMQILANQAPIGFEAEFVNQRGLTVLYRGILLPYSSDNETIDFIYGVINWKELADAKTADELLLQIDQALAADDADADHVETEFEATEDTGMGHDEDIAAADDAGALDPVAVDEDLSVEANDDWDNDDTVLDLGAAPRIEVSDPSVMPAPTFGAPDGVGQGDEGYGAIPARRERGVDALGNPLGGMPHDDGYDAEDDDSFDTGMKTAADYGLPDWDDEPDEDDVEDVVDPLADDEASSSLISLVNRGDRLKKTVNLEAGLSAAPFPQAFEAEDDEADAFPAYFDRLSTRVPQAYEVAPEAHSFDPAHDRAQVYAQAAEFVEDGSGDDGMTAPDEAELAEPAELAETAPEGLYDCLAAAREQAQAAQNTEDRSRKALYAAVGLAYDFSLEAQDSPEDFQEIIDDNGLTMQDRAPMTPVVKLVFGADYDKTRLTEYAAVLTHAHRLGVERGTLAGFLREAEGGLKGIVQAERRARKEEQGKPVEDDGTGIRPALARKLRGLDTSALVDVSVDGPEFALVMVRRTEDGELVVVGEIEEDRVLLEKAARKLLGK